jgi:hypothetical protein
MALAGSGEYGAYGGYGGLVMKEKALSITQYQEGTDWYAGHLGTWYCAACKLPSSLRTGGA